MVTPRSARGNTPNLYSVLITDDDDGCRDSLQSIIEPRGYRTYLADSGDEALRIFRAEYIDVAILDVNLPGMTGLETWRRFKKEANRVLPCVFVTGDVASASSLESMREPEFVVVRKPLTKERVIKALESMILRFLHRGLSVQNSRPPSD